MIDIFLSKINILVPTRWKWILAQEGLYKYLKNTGWMLLGQMFLLLVYFFIGAWIARYLGPSDFGIVNYALAFVGVFSFVSYLGVDGILSRELVKCHEKKDVLLGTAFFLKLLGGFFAFTLVCIFVFFINHDSLTRTLIIVYSISFFLQAPFVINLFFQSQVQAYKNVKAQLFGALISSILKILLILSGKGIIWLIVIYVVDSIWQSLFLVIFYKKQGLKIFSWKYDPRLAKEILNDSLPLMLSSAASFVYLKIDQIMVGRIMGDTSVGVYAVGVKITEIFYFIPNIICGSLFPAIINAKMVDEDQYRKRLKSIYYLLVFLGLVVSIAIFLLSTPLISLVFGAQYLGAISVLKIYIWSSTGLFLGTGFITYLMAENKTRTILFLNVAAMVVNVILNLILIPILGLTGAALATVVAYSVIPFSMLFLKKYFNV